MPSLPPTFRPKHQPTARQLDRERGSARERGYTTQWDRESRAHLRAHPLCAYCALDGIVTAANTVDHFWGRGEGNVWFWVREWWVSTCPTCHSGFKQSIERQGRAALLDLALRLGVSAPG